MKAKISNRQAGRADAQQVEAHKLTNKTTTGRVSSRASQRTASRIVFDLDSEEYRLQD
jgi:hypothetical protein